MSDFLKRIGRRSIEAMPDALFERYTNSRNKLKGYRHRITVDSQRKIIHVQDPTGEINICRRNRLWLYKKSVKGRFKELNRTYLLHRIDGDLSGAFIDCGANVGELGFFARENSLQYHAFEPETLEADCCDLNNYSGLAKTNRVALWNEKTTLSFYSKPDTGDGSIIEMNDFDGIKKVQAIRLDDFVAEHQINAIAVMKIEAEGAEPEILAGASQALSMTRYLTVDCGFERGRNKESTLTPVINAATKAGFSVVDWNPSRTVFLFKNERI
jgi:FkbM family methyltransferase